MCRILVPLLLCVQSPWRFTPAAEDAQLRAAVEHLLERIREETPLIPPPPPYPDRSLPPPTP